MFLQVPREACPAVLSENLSFVTVHTSSMQALWSVIVTRLETQKQNNNILVLSGHQDVEPKSQKVIGFSHLSQPCVFISGQNTYQCQTQD